MTTDRIANKFRENTKQAESGCIEWTGKLTPHGYGQTSMKIDGRRTTAAHRAAWMIFCGPIPDGLVIDHLCRVRHCVNVEHLELVTPRENTRRGVEAKGGPGMPRQRSEGQERLVTPYSKGTQVRMFRVEDDLWQAAQDKATREGTSVSEYVRAGLTKWVGKPHSPKPPNKTPPHPKQSGHY